MSTQTDDLSDGAKKPEAETVTASAVAGDANDEIKKSDGASQKKRVSFSGVPPLPPVRFSLRWWWQHPELIAVLLTAIICICVLRMTSRVSDQKLFTPKALSFYNGEKGAPLYIAILGEVYDVTAGRKHYGDGGYGFFVGKDASRAFITGDFQADLHDDVADFTPEQCKGLVGWRDFYRKHETYKYRGRVSGRFYTSSGGATSLLGRVEAAAARAKSAEQIQREMEAQYVSCNTRWTEAEGSTVWCDGGAYPRKVTLTPPPGAEVSPSAPRTKCACFQEVGWSDLRQVYEGCRPDAHTCRLPKPKEAEGVKKGAQGGKKGAAGRGQRAAAEGATGPEVMGGGKEEL